MRSCDLARASLLGTPTCARAIIASSDEAVLMRRSSLPRSSRPSCASVCTTRLCDDLYKLRGRGVRCRRTWARPVQGMQLRDRLREGGADAEHRARLPDHLAGPYRRPADRSRALLGPCALAPSAAEAGGGRGWGCAHEWLMGARACGSR